MLVFTFLFKKVEKKSKEDMSSLFLFIYLSLKKRGHVHANFIDFLKAFFGDTIAIDVESVHGPPSHNN